MTLPRCHVERSETSLTISAGVRNHDYWLYILTNKHCTTLYIGITNNIARRLAQHRCGEVDGFTKRYHLNRLVWLEHFRNVNDAIACEKKLKAGAAVEKSHLSNKQIHDGSISVTTGNSSQSSMIALGSQKKGSEILRFAQNDTPTLRHYVMLSEAKHLWLLFSVSPEK